MVALAFPGRRSPLCGDADPGLGCGTPVAFPDDRIDDGEVGLGFAVERRWRSRQITLSRCSRWRLTRIVAALTTAMRWQSALWR
jgi:hypothetical protein